MELVKLVRTKLKMQSNNPHELRIVKGKESANIPAIIFKKAAFGFNGDCIFTTEKQIETTHADCPRDVTPKSFLTTQSERKIMDSLA